MNMSTSIIQLENKMLSLEHEVSEIEDFKCLVENDMFWLCQERKESQRKEKLESLKDFDSNLARLYKAVI